MAAIQKLTPGQRYRVVRAFVDYDGQAYPVGETWVFEHTNFVPYEDGLTLHVSAGGLPVVYRLQWRPGEQAALIENFTHFVVAC
ncbi:DUF3601 domain-containing protein [Hymenobacter caeli]|uniref:DUF3601 domain-containing protein n=1 Tax=Hymenobacter caeli TaxID=2735894 RepID=A0ABX2FTB9_9BACT|nr:DUF3601 domain-containing protein [Hymenobacter caeli]NRT19719.1 hypothetical protein [Hymenobacter caeli]